MALSESTTAETSNSLASLIVISKDSVLVVPSVEVAITSICIVDIFSKSIPSGSATVTTPVSASIANALFGLLDKL